MKYLLLTVLLCMENVIQSNGNYYWRYYQKHIPADAYSAGEHYNKENVYIGQAFLCESICPGPFPTSISNDKDIYVAMFGAKIANKYVQILCTSEPDRFEWLSANSTHLHLLNTKNEIVVGGMECNNNNGLVAIGRARVHGETVIGKVMQEMVGVADMWFVHNQVERKAVIFEVLTYKPKSTEWRQPL